MDQSSAGRGQGPLAASHWSGRDGVIVRCGLLLSHVGPFSGPFAPIRSLSPKRH